MRQYPIWNRVTNCNYASDKSYGNKRRGIVDVFVGTSSSNSHHFLQHEIRYVSLTDAQWFLFYVDDTCVKQCLIYKGWSYDLPKRGDKARAEKELFKIQKREKK